jgi:hypothetical protein
VKGALAKGGEDLLAQRYKRFGFMQAIRDGCPIEWAGLEILGVGKSRARDIKKEIEECGDVDNWYRVEALRKMTRRKIGRGREVRQSPLADAFFKRLIDGGESWNSLQARFGDTSVVDAAAEVHRETNPFNKEAVDYMISN